VGTQWQHVIHLRKRATDVHCGKTFIETYKEAQEYKLPMGLGVINRPIASTNSKLTYNRRITNRIK
jgi:hypothetical protein